MKLFSNIVGFLLGVAFLIFGLNYFFHFLPDFPKPEKDSNADLFFRAIASSGYLKFIKYFEIIGGIFVIIPLLRNWGLLILGPIVINILAINYFIIGSNALLDPAVISISVLSFLLLLLQSKFFFSKIFPKK